MSQAQAAIITSQRPQIRRILLTTDFSSCSAAAAGIVRVLARCFGSTVVVTHVLPPEPRLSVPLDRTPRQLDKAWADAEKQMEQFLVANNLKDIPTETVIEHGAIWDVLAATLQEHKIDLLALGTHGRGAVAKFVLGSVAERIFRSARCPVLTVGPEAREAWTNVGVIASRGGERNLETVLFATDFSAGSLNALPYAIALADASAAELLLLHVIGPSGLSPLRYEEVKDCHERLSSLVPAGTMLRGRSNTLVRPGVAAEVILETAQERAADLIVMGARPLETQLAEAPGSASKVRLPGTTAYRVASHAQCPVLTVRS